ncbi:MAG: hypothetical protein VX899_03995 [Myxococcota bacterium]|nr:hypothetical protein [Myxococcota bacterium]
MKHAKRLGFSLLVLVLFFGGTEVLLRVLGLPTQDERPVFEHNKVYWQVEDNLVDEPMTHKELGVSFPVSTDDHGFRPPHHDSPGSFRIAAMGCSTTFGWGVADSETYPAQLQAILRERGHDVQVINAGQPGYTSFQGLWLWDQELADMDIDLALAGFVVQDAREVAYSDKSQAVMQGEADFLKSNVLYKWRLYQVLQTSLGAVQTRAKEHGNTRRVPGADYLENLRALRAKVQAGGGEIAHFGYPLEVAGYTEEHRRLLRLEAQDKGIPHLDPSETIAQRVRAGERLYFAPQDPGHANAAGNRAIAELVADWLIQEGLVP